MHSLSILYSHTLLRNTIMPCVYRVYNVLKSPGPRICMFTPFTCIFNLIVHGAGGNGQEEIASERTG